MASRQLQKSVHQFEEAEELAQIGSWSLEIPTQKLYWSSQMYKFFGQDPQTNEPDFDAHLTSIHPEDLPHLTDVVDRCAKDGQAYQVEFRILDKADPNEVRWILALGKGKKDSFGKVIRLGGTCQDITDEKILRDELERANEINKDLQSQASIAGWEYDVANHEVTWTDETNEIRGFDLNSFIDQDLARQLFAEADQMAVWSCFQRCLNTGESYSIEGRLKKQNDEFMSWVRVTGRAIQDSHGVIRKVRGTLQDISESKKTQLDLDELNSVFHTLYESADTFITVTDDQGIPQMLSPSILNLIGQSESDLKQKPIWVWMDADSETKLRKMYSDLESNRAKESCLVEARVMNSQGVSSFISWTVEPLNKQRKMCLVGQDRTSQRRKELQVQFTLEEMQVGTWSVDIENHHINWDNNNYLVFGVTPERFQPTVESFMAFMEPSQQQHFMNCWQRALAGRQSLNTEIEVTLPTGAKRIIGARGELKVDSEGCVKMIGINWDKTDESRMRDELLEQKKVAGHISKLASLGELAAGVGHEINNPLAVIKGYLSSVKVKKEKGTLDQNSLIEVLDKIETASDRIVKIVDGLRFFSHSGEGKAELDISHDLSQTVDMFAALFEKDQVKVTFENFHTGRPAIVCGNHGKLQQVILNLLNNARDATEGLEERTVEVRLLKENERVVIEIEDNGSGIPFEVQERIFEPFFTTKEVNKGCGIGLSICHSIIHEHAGEISFQTNTEEGTCFRVDLPLMTYQEDSSKARQANIKEKSVSPIVGETVMLVDDEPEICELYGTLLESQGLCVKSFSNGQDAFDFWKSNPGEIDVVLSDIKMPQMTGVDLVNSIQAEGQGETLLLLMTGGVQKGSDYEFKSTGPSEIFYKPFSIQEILRSIQKNRQAQKQRAA